MGYPYDASRKALLTPARDASFFAAGRPAAESSLCAELAWIAYAPFERDPAARTTVAAALERIGFTSLNLFSAGGTHGFLARDSTTRLSVLTFRGTEPNLKNWETDLTTELVPWSGGGRVHRGFAEALSTVWDSVLADLKTVTGRCLYTGHSLGAGLATLAASRRTPDALITFGSPRVGDDAFAHSPGRSNHHRYANCCDVVTRVPLEAMGYRHTGTLVYLDRDGRSVAAPTESLILDDQRHARLGYLSRWAWRPGTMWTRDAADHAPVNYVSALQVANQAR